jgi:hypothetical protein
MQTREVTIAKHTFTVSLPFAPGHVLTEGEAKALNQTRTENISNSLRKKLTDLLGDEPSAEAIAEAEAMVKELDDSYQFTVANASGGRRVADPLEKECRAVARAYIAAQLKDAGKTAKEMGKEWMDEKIEVVASNEKIIALAKKRIAERAKLAESVDLAL